MAWNIKPSKDRFSDLNTAFERELSKIKDQNCRKTVVEMLRVAPEEFWFGPSSYSGKYHSADEFGMGGNVLHTRRVFRALMVLLDAAYEKMDDDLRDEAMAAALVHDTLQGSTGSADHVSSFESYYDEHLDEDTKELKWWRGIVNIANHHMGRWSPELLRPAGITQWLLHQADMVATKFDHLQILKDKDYNLRK